MYTLEQLNEQFPQYYKFLSVKKYRSTNVDLLDKVNQQIAEKPKLEIQKESNEDSNLIRFHRQNL